MHKTEFPKEQHNYLSDVLNSDKFDIQLLHLFFFYQIICNCLNIEIMYERIDLDSLKERNVGDSVEVTGVVKPSCLLQQ